MAANIVRDADNPGQSHTSSESFGIWEGFAALRYSRFAASQLLEERPFSLNQLISKACFIKETIYMFPLKVRNGNTFFCQEGSVR